jgi:ABC-2 type transport system permease protein
MLEIYRHDIRGSFYSWKGGIWIVAASLIFSLVTYLLLTDKELSLLDQGEMLFTLAEVILSLGIIMSVITASSSISNEIESGTFESLLLTPITSWQLAFQKLLMVITIWIILYIVSIPYLLVVASGTNLGISAILYVGLYGLLLIMALSAVSVAISGKFRSSKNSIMAMIMIVLILLSPSIFFASSLKKTDFGLTLENINPVSHALNSLDSVLVDNEQSLIQQIGHVWPIIVFAVICGIFFTIYTIKYEIKGLE